MKDEKKSQSLQNNETQAIPTSKFFDNEYSKRMLLKTTVVPSIVALIEKLIMHPVDTAITFQQNQNQNLTNTLSHIYKQYGFLGFYRGLSYPLLLSAPPGAILIYGSYEGFKESFAKRGYATQTANALASSLLTGLLLTLLSTPLEAKRIRDTFGIQVATPENKVKYFFRGFSPMLFKFMVQAPIVLAGTDILKIQLNKYGKNSKSPFLQKLSDSNSSYSTFFGGLITGAFAQIVTTPADVIKTKIMADYNSGPLQLSLRQHIYKTYKEKNLFSSLGSRMFRWGLHSSITLGFIQIFNQQFIKNNESHYQNQKNTP